ncbi:MAG: KAP family NTPase [Prevotellaceae bacterium]|jgi:hypothetical protein|nr:KAP family NTPase [Prevotellaceae bacterium]
MKILFQNLPYKPGNRLYKNVIDALVEQIFDGYDWKKHGDYIIINDNRPKYTYFSSESQYKSADPGISRELIDIASEAKIEHVDFIADYSGLGTVEKALINRLLIGEEGVIVLTGALGSGKTALLRYVSTYLDKHKNHGGCRYYGSCQRHKDIHVFFDFNAFPFTPKDDIVVEFYRKLFYDLIENIQDVFCRCIILDSFIEDHQRDGIFFGMRKALMNNPDWSQWGETDKLEGILEWIIDKYERFDIKTGVYALLKMLTFYHDTYPRRDQTCFLCIFDNIDILYEEYQKPIIEELNKISQASKIKIILTTRITTFNHVRNNYSFPFRVFEHVGIFPMELVLKRMEHYRNNRKNEEAQYVTMRQNIDRAYLKNFDDRLDFIYDQLKNQRYERLGQTLESLSGLSVRRSLQLCKRLFYNHTIPWDEVDPKEDILIRCLHSYDFDAGKMHPDDHLITNIFRDPNNGYPSLILLRILNALYIARANNDITIQNLIDHISIFDKSVQNQERADYIIQILRSPEKRLLYVSGFGPSEDAIAAKRNSKVKISRSGELYLNHLCRNLQYIQNCFEIIEWNITVEGNITEAIRYINNNCPDEHSKTILLQSLLDIQNRDITEMIPNEVDYDQLHERFRSIRMALRFLFNKDVLETINYKLIYERNESVRNIFEINSLITVPVIAHVAQSILNITKPSMENNTVLTNEVMQWKDLIFMIHEWTKLLFRRSRHIRLLEDTLNRYDEIITANENKI